MQEIIQRNRNCLYYYEHNIVFLFNFISFYLFICPNIDLFICCPCWTSKSSQFDDIYSYSDFAASSRCPKIFFKLLSNHHQAGILLAIFSIQKSMLISTCFSMILSSKFYSNFLYNSIFFIQSHNLNSNFALCKNLMYNTRPK